MELIYMVFIGIIGIIIAIGVGLEISKGIDEFTVSMLFWILYSITIITFINIILVWNYYQNMKDKKGPLGNTGKIGQRGEKGETGLCDTNCRDSICENALNELIIDKLKENNNGVVIKMNNVYIKSKIRQMCASDEFKQLAPYNGNLNLNNYLKTIWTKWFDLIYESGGLNYFQTIGAETEFEWLKENPFDELKKYDVFYWGMGKQYRPQLVDRCYNSIDGINPNTNGSQYILNVSSTNFYTKIHEINNLSDANKKMSVWRANQFTYKNNVFYPVGDVVINTTNNNNLINTSEKKVGAFPINSDYGPSINTIIVSGDVVGPINYELIWTNKMERGNHFWIWRPIPPANYIALGDIITTSNLKPETGEKAPIRCIPKDITKLTEPSPQNVVWTSQGIRTSFDNKISFISTSTHNNIFKGVKGNNLNIPKSDVNGSFYTLQPNNYDYNFEIGRENGNPDTNNIANRVGKGYIPSPQKDSKYSIMSYVNLKNNATLTHSTSSKVITCNLIPNAIGNAYLVKDNNQCLDFVNNQLKKSECDELIDSQIFSIIFTGNKKNQCYLRHYKSNKILIYNQNGNKLFNLISENDNNNNQNSLFIME